MRSLISGNYVIVDQQLTLENWASNEHSGVPSLEALRLFWGVRASASSDDPCLAPCGHHGWEIVSPYWPVHEKVPQM